MNKSLSFDSEKYLELQFEAFDKKQKEFEGLTIFEFGGKPFGDNHAARVLPGYDPDLKSKLLSRLQKIAKVVIAINAKDILSYPYGRTLQGRVRGDTGLRYDDEVVRILNESESKGFKISEVVLTCVPISFNETVQDEIETFRKKLGNCQVLMKLHYEINDYPNPKCLDGFPFDKNEVVSDGRNLVVISPGGGSGKFGLILSEVSNLIKSGVDPNFIKFETFPVFKLEASHALNLAFEAATADQGNKVKHISGGTNYNKDLENFLLLKHLLKQLKYTGKLSKIGSPLDWGVNVIEKGIIDMDEVIKACREEIYRRKDRYENEMKNGIERQETLNRVEDIIKKFDKKYQGYF